MFISFQPQVFHNPPVGNNQNQLIWAGPEIWFDVTFRGEVLDGSEASAGCCWAEGDDLLEKQNGKVGWAVVVFWMLMFFFGCLFWEKTFGKQPRRNTRVVGRQFAFGWFQVTGFFVWCPCQTKTPTRSWRKCPCSWDLTSMFVSGNFLMLSPFF